MSGGAAANKSGQLGERLVAEVLRHFGVGFAPQFRPGICGLLDKDVRIDFHIPRARGFEEGLYIEARWQDSTGSIDQKIPALVANIKSHYDRKTILVIDGAESDKARNYASDCIGGNLIAVVTLAEFVPFCKAMSEGGGERYIAKMFDPSQGRLWGAA